MACNPNIPEAQNDDSKNQADSSKTEVNQKTDDATEGISFKIQEYGDEEIGLSYPIMEGGKESVRKAFNDEVEKEVFKLIYQKEADGIEAAIEAFKSDSEENGGMYSLNINPTDVYVKDEILSFGLNWSAYQGGAHPNSASIAMNFDAKTGKFLSQEDILLDKEAFTNLVEQKFRKQVGIKEAASINSAGYEFENNQFKLPEYIIYTEKGLNLYYNPYEIAAYVMGGTELPLIPYAEVKGMLKGVD